MHFPTLLHGTAEAAADELDRGGATPDELCAALTNALTRIHYLEQSVAKLIQANKDAQP